MKDILSSLRLQIYERLSSPLFGSFVIAWICWNHRLLSVLFSSLPVSERFQFIDSVLLRTTWGAWSQCFVYPAASALAFIFIYPYPSKWILGFWLRRQNESKELRDKIDGETLLTRDESQAIKKKALEANLKHEETIRQLRDELETAKELARSATSTKEVTTKSTTGETAQELRHSQQIIAELQGEIAALRNTSAKGDELEKGPHEVIRKLAENNGRLSRAEIFNSFKEPRIRVEHYLDKIGKLGLTNTNTLSGDAAIVSLTSEGRAYAVDFGFV